MKQFITENLRYPQEALEHKIEGTVTVQYDIDYQGKVVSAKVISGIGHGCDEEAMRLAKMLIYQMPKNRGVRVIFHKTMQVHFRLPKVKQVPVQVQYDYVSTQSQQGEVTSGGGYTFTIST